jgi:hypothetical protein
MPWATGDNVQVCGLCTTKQDAMGPARLNCHAMGHRRQCSSVWAVHNKTRRDGPGTSELSCHGPQATIVQVRGLCTTKQDAMGPARVNCHAMGHRRQCSSAWAVHNKTRRDGPGTTEMSCHGPQATMFKCMGCAQQNKTRWARHE